MSEAQAFGQLVAGLSPWLEQLVFVGGWAFRLYRLHPDAQVPAYRPVVTLDADVAFAEGERLEGSIRARLLEAGFVESLTGNHRPPVSPYTLGDDGSGFYAEFLTPLTGSGRRRSGEPLATVARAGVSAQRLRHLDLAAAGTCCSSRRRARGCCRHWRSIACSAKATWSRSCRRRCRTTYWCNSCLH